MLVLPVGKEPISCQAIRAPRAGPDARWHLPFSKNASSNLSLMGTSTSRNITVVAWSIAVAKISKRAPLKKWPLLGLACDHRHRRGAQHRLKVD